MIPFARMHGSGNDFVVIDDRAGRLRPHRRALTVALCDRRQGVGGDGVVLLSNGQSGHVEMRYINADGNDGEMCGNGAGCAVRRAWELGLFHGSETILDTDAGPVGASIDDRRVTLAMPNPANERLNLSIATSEGTFAGHAVDIGVPHVVLFVNHVAPINVERLGPEIRRHPLFPRGCNVNWAAKCGDNSFRMRTYERGVEAETLSCGTGATAIALMAYRLDLARSPIAIHATGGGVLTVSFDETTEGALRNVRTSVEVERIAEGLLDADWLARRGLTL